MVSRPCMYLVWVAALLPIPLTAVAQTVSATTGAIDGTVLDQTGGAVPGVAITATGDALMVPRTVLTTQDGTYRFPALPPGSYGLSFALTGFETATRGDIRVSVGVTATVDVTLVVNHGELVMVQGAALVDRKNTGIATVFHAGELERLPGARTPTAILAATPAVHFTRFDVGGSTAFSAGPFSVYGTFGFNRPTIEGISVSNMHPLGFALDYGTFASVSVGAGAYAPEWPSPGLHIQFITKSGGNRYAGSIYAGFEDRAWQAHNIDARQIAAGAPAAPGLAADESNRLQFYRDLNGDAGGYIRKDRLWWYASTRDHASSARQVNFPSEPIDTRVTTATGKGTWRVADGHHIVLFGHGSRNRQPIRLDGFLRGATARNTSRESTVSQLAEGIVWKAEWNASLGPNLFLEARGGQFVASRAERPNGAGPRTEDRNRLEVSGGNRDWQENWHSDQVNAAVSYFRDGPFGRHQFKAGVEIQRLLGTDTWRHAYPGDVLHVTQQGRPREVYLFETPSRSQSGQWWYVVHGGDTWQVNDRLTLNAGLRFDRLRVFLPEQHHPVGRFNDTPRTFPAVDTIADWNVVAPRLGASYDLSGDGRTILKASYGLHWLPTGLELGFNANPNGRVWWRLYDWTDANGDFQWQRGEEFGPTDQRGGEAVESIDPELRLDYINEMTARIEREAAPRLFVSTGLIWRGEWRLGSRVREFWPIQAFNVPEQVRDPGPDAALGTADDGARIQLYHLQPDLVGPSPIVVRSLPHAASRFLTWEIVARRQLSGRWSLAGAFAHTWNRDHAREFFGQAVRANEFPQTPNDLVNTDAHGRHVYRNWTANVHGTWDGPWRIRVAPLLRHQSGQAFGRTLITRLNYAAFPVLTEPVGTRRQRHVTLLDVRIERDVWRAGSSSLTPFLEVFNTLNANPEQNVGWETGPSFLRPLAIVPPRIARVGFRLEW